MTAPSPAPPSPAPGPATLDEIFRINARRRPDAIAFADPPDRSAFTDGTARQLTYAEADAAIAAIAARLRELELPRGSAVGLQLPNIVESAVALLGVMRAGLVAAPLPLLWRRAEAARALGAIGARALLTCARVAGTDHGDLALHVAADTFGIRYVCGFGERLPDGIVPFDGIWTATRTSDASDAELELPVEPGDVAVVTFDAGPEGPAPMPRSQAELLAGGLAVVLESGLPPETRVLNTMLLSSFPVIATTLVPALLTGGALAFHHPFDAAVFTRQLAEQACDAVAVPGPLVSALAAADCIGSGPTRVLSLWRAPERQPASPPWSGNAPLIDILAFGEVGLVPLRRRTGEPPSMTAGALTAPAGAPDGAVVMTIARSAGGTLALGGPMVPKHLLASAAAETDAPSPTREIDTGFPCRVEPRTNRVTITGPPPGLTGVGGYRFAISELQDMVGRLDPDSILTALPDLLAGEKLAGLAADPVALREKLLALGINPLIAEAFRDPAQPARTSAA